MNKVLRTVLCLVFWPVGVPYLLHRGGHSRAAGSLAVLIAAATLLSLSAVPWDSLNEPSTPVVGRHEGPGSRVAYKILSDRKTPRTKRKVEVRLSEKVTAAVLQSIAYEVRDLDTTKYERTFILYYLPDMSTDRAAWATTVFKPELEVAIRGTTLEQDQQVSVRPELPSPRPE